MSKVHEYDNLHEFFEQFELLRFFWTKDLNLKDSTQQIALFSIVYYLLDFQDNQFNFYFGEDKEELTNDELDLWLDVNEFIEVPKESYKNYILDYLSHKFKVTNAKEVFDEHLTHLYEINFAIFTTSEFFDQFTHRYLLYFLFTEDFSEIDLEKDVIIIDENSGKINLEELTNQFDRLDIKYGDQYDFFQFKQMEMRIFIEHALRKTLNNGMIMMRNKFGHF